MRTSVARFLGGTAALAMALAPAMIPRDAHAGARQQAQVFLPADVQERKLHEDWGFASTLVFGDTIYVSGIVAEMKPGQTLEQGYEIAYQRLAEILAQAGASWDDVVDITTFHTDIAVQMPIITQVQKKYVLPPQPAWVAVGVTRLIPPNGVTEFKIVARRSQQP